MSEEDKEALVAGVATGVEKLAFARKALLEAQAAVESVQLELKARPEYAHLLEVKAEESAAAEAAKRAYTELTLLAYVAYEAVGNKDVTDGVKIRVMRKAVYVEEQALTWAKEQAPNFTRTTLDADRFEKAALAGVLDNVPTLEVREVPQAVVDSDLSRFVPIVLSKICT